LQALHAKNILGLTMARNWERTEYRRGRSVVSLLKERRYRGPERPGLRGGMQGSGSIMENSRVAIMQLSESMTVKLLV
jgi:hypothetical protein